MKFVTERRGHGSQRGRWRWRGWGRFELSRWSGPGARYAAPRLRTQQFASDEGAGRALWPHWKLAA